MKCKLSEKFFPMNTDASDFEDINIHQIIERLSTSCIESSVERFSIFRERSDSKAVAESISISMTNSLDTGFPVPVFDISPDFRT